ncbi:MAG: carbamoyltransferase HypF, partial [bacterium]
MENIKRIRILVSGLVQGVGFRPTTYRYAHEFLLSGYVSNTPEGVTIEVQGISKNIDAFVKKLLSSPPPLAKIIDFDIEQINTEEESDFVILHSSSYGNKKAEISSDIAVCKDCLLDIEDKTNRRYLYPFTNCTNCGPRFSIIQDRPYDRNQTSMSVFKMCEDCQKEYDDPKNRRFHAQPNACPKCGPSLILLNSTGSVEGNHDDLIGRTALLIKEGKIVAIKGIGGFNIVCDPFNNNAVQRLRFNKNRPSKSFALMAKDLMTIQKYCYVSDKEQQILESKETPIVLLRKKNNLLDSISIDNNYLGFVLPYTPLHHILFRSVDVLVMTSANKSDEPIAINDEQINFLMKEKIVDNSLTHNREIINRCDDSIVQVIGDKLQVIRRSRGFVPAPFNIGATVWGNNLSMGADLKNTFSIKKGNKIYISQHIG